MMRLLKILVLGVMLACGTAYASESPAPAPVTNSKANHAALNTDASPAVGDLIFDGGIAFLIIVMGAFFAIGFLDSKEKDSQ